MAKKKNITGRLSSLFFIGCGLGSLVTPPLSGYFFTRLGAASILQLTLGLCVTQCLLFCLMWLLGRPAATPPAATPTTHVNSSYTN